jgi:hypothetical protein
MAPSVSFGSRFREKTPVGSGLDDIRFIDRDMTPIEVAYLHENGVPHLDRDSLKRQLVELEVATDARVTEAAKHLEAAREVENQLRIATPEVLVMREVTHPRDAYVLNRGLHRARGPGHAPGAATDFPVERGTAEEPHRSRAVDLRPKNPLTARVFVNRMWQQHFGQGLVDTSENFGVQGRSPRIRSCWTGWPPSSSESAGISSSFTARS